MIIVLLLVLVAQTICKKQCSSSVFSWELGVTGVPRCKGNSLRFAVIKVVLTL